MDISEFLTLVKSADKRAKIHAKAPVAKFKPSSALASTYKALQPMYRHCNGFILRRSHGSKDGVLHLLPPDRWMTKSQIDQGELLTLITDLMPPDSVVISIDANGDAYYFHSPKRKAFARIDQDGSIGDDLRTVEALLADIAERFLSGPKVIDGVNAIWRSDGTAKGTEGVWQESIAYANLVPVSDGVAFSTRHGDRREIRFAPSRAIDESFPSSFQQVITEQLPSDPMGIAGANGLLLYAFRPSPGKLAIGAVKPVTDYDSIPKPKVLKEIDDISVASASCHLTVVGDTAYFVVSASDTAHELWRTDGTKPGTRRVITIKGTRPHNLTAAGGRLFFIGSDIRE